MPRLMLAAYFYGPKKVITMIVNIFISLITTRMQDLRGSRDSAVGTALSPGRPRYRISSPCRGRIFLLSTLSRLVLGLIQPIQWATGALPSGIKRPKREADNSLPTSAEVQNTWICTSTKPHAFVA
jgi:hypothetical protein